MSTHGIRDLLLRILGVLIVCSILLSPQFTIPVYAQTGMIRFENISTEQGLSQSTINAIIQDRQGFLWFATEGGLNQYDGYQFTVYQHDQDNPKSLSSNLINSIFEDRDGTLWIGTSTGLDRLDRSSKVFIHYQKDLTSSDGLSGISVQAIAQDESGTLWIGTGGGGLYSLDLTTDRITEYKQDPGNPSSLSDDYINSIYLSREGELWLGTDGGLDRFDPAAGSFIHTHQHSSGSSLPDNTPVQTIYEDSQSMMWIGTHAGLVRWDRAANRFVLYKHDTNIPGSLSDDSIRSIYADSRGMLWIGTRGGLDQFDQTQNNFVHYTHNPNDIYSLSSDSIRAIFEDRSGVLWIGTSDGGLNKYAHATQKFDLYAYSPGLPNNLSDNNIWSIYENSSGGLWIGTFSSGLNMLDRNSGQITTYKNNPLDSASLSNNDIRAILEDRKGTLWVGTEYGGLNQFDLRTGTFLHFRYNAADPDSLSNDAVFTIFEDHQGRLWIGTEHGGLNRFDQASGSFIHYKHDARDLKSLSDDDVRAIYEDHAGDIWIGTFGGVDLWDNQDNHFTIYRNDPGNASSLSNNMVTSICEDKNGTIWIGTFGGGLNRFDRNTQSFIYYTVKNGLPDDTIYGILVDTAGSLWLSTNKGLSKFNPSTETFRNYDTSDGLQGNQFNPGAYFQGQNGEILFGGTKGFNAFIPQDVGDNPIPPPVVITAFKKYNQTIQTDLVQNESIQLTYRDNFISFDFSALDYNAPEKNQYAYMLEGVDQDWVYAGMRRYASYTNLRGGNYTFRVKATNNDGIWNSGGTEIRIHITPPFWQTWWFIGIIGLVVVTGAVSGYRLRIREIEARNRDLAKRVEQRTHQLAALNNIAEVVSQSLDLTEILNNALEKTLAVMHMNTGGAFGLEELPDGRHFKLLAIRGMSDDYAKTVRSISLSSVIMSKAVEAGRPLVIYGSEHPNLQIKEANVREGIQLTILLPLLVKGKLVGAVTLAGRETREITEEELSLLAAIGQQVGMAVVNARLYEQAEQTAITTERDRLARELHDSVTQLMYSVTLYAEAASELLESGEIKTAAGHLRDLRDTAQEALREMRLLIFELHRPALGQGGLVAALQARLDAVETRGGMHTELVVEGDEQISSSVQAELYNIAQEALNNALKHAHANSVQIHLRFGHTETEMHISDDGVGFEPAEGGTRGGFGISGMKERSQKIGGALQIDSAPGKGTNVVVWVPMNPRERHTNTEAESPQGEME